jgi:chromosomal replication initiator protein
MDDRELVAAIRARLAHRIGQDRYEVWFGATTQMAMQGENLVVSVPNQFFQDWLRSNFRKELETASLDVCNKPLALEFRIAAATAATSLAQARPAITERVAPCREPQSHATAERPAPSLAASGGCGAGQVPQINCHVPLPRRPLATLESFVAGDANCLAHKAAQLAADRPGAYSPLFLHGPTGTGKSHLLEGIYASFRQKHPRAAAVMLSAEQFTGDFLEALHGSGMPSFRRKYRGVELLVIDDLQFFKDKRATLGELLHTIDTLLRAGRQVVLAADRAPTALKSLGPELQARLAGGMTCRIEPPEYATRRGIVRQLAVRFELAIPDEVEAFIASHFTSQSRELAGALKRLKATAAAHGRAITLAVAEEALADLVDNQRRAVKLSDIERAVCDVFGLQPDSLQSSGKGQVVSQPRMLAMWLARKHTRAPLSEIGSYFGRRSHSTVISAQKKIESQLASHTRLRLATNSLSLEETIRRVEDNLRAG